MRPGDVVKKFELRTWINSRDGCRNHMDKFFQEKVEKGWTLPEGYRPVGGGIGVVCPTWLFYLYTNDNIVYEIKPQKGDGRACDQMTAKKLKEYMLHGDTNSGKSTDGRGTFKT